MPQDEPHPSRDTQEPLEIETFHPESVELIDPQRTAGRPEAAGHGYHPWKRQPRTRKRLSLILFITTCFSTVFAGAGLWMDAFFPLEVIEEILEKGVPKLLIDGFSYAVPVMAILLSHEMGHYLQARRYDVPASLPYFVPMPISPFGTMGAVILQGAGVANRKQMFDIAITGPLAGLVLALPVAWYGVQISELVFIKPNDTGLAFGQPLILQWMVSYVHGPMAENQTVSLNPLMFAGWVGVFITALNLIPIGQLDGGHILYCLIGRRAHPVAMLLLAGAIVYMVYNRKFDYMLIVILLLLFGPKHPPTADDRVPIGLPRVLLGWLTLAFILIGFTPTPIVQFGAPQPKPRQQRQEAEWVQVERGAEDAPQPLALRAVSRVE